MNKNDPILITGGNGFLGKSITRKLKFMGYTNCFTFRSSEYDLRNKDCINSLFKKFEPKVVIHLAAKVGGIGANRNNPATFCYDNLSMGINVIEKCHSSNVEKLVIAGTICAYPKFTKVPFKEDDLWNGYPEETNAPYGLAKKMLLVMAQSYRQQYGDNFIFLLPVNLYGPNDNLDIENNHVIPAMIKKFHEAKVENKNVVLWGNGSATREFLYVDDCAEAFVLAMEKYNGNDPINIGSGQEISIFDLSNKIKDLVEFKGIVEWDKTKPNGQPRRCLDISRSKEYLSWEPKIKLEEGLKKTYSWFLGLNP